MAEQLRMALDGEPVRSRASSGRRRRDPEAEAAMGRHPTAQAGRRRPRPPANRPVRGEPDVVDEPVRPEDWRIDQRTRLAGLRGIARARAVLLECGPEGDGPGRGQVDAA